MTKPENAISPTRGEDYPQWYQQVIRAADLAELSPVRGCMVIKPWGYALWENIQQTLDRMFKSTGHVNAYFPLFIPLSFLEKEAAHVEGFAKECAVVTHHRLEKGPDGKLVPTGELEEPLIVRPTSETIIGASYAKWVQSYRDLPILINQWANVVRWEMRPRIFLRTAEFLWQEGHTVHATKEEAMEETYRMLDVYADFAENHMAMPVIKGEKSPGERFPGAVNTYSIEAMMQDRKALQAGTSHFLGQNFAKASEIKFLSKDGKEEIAWTTSWGMSTRTIGGIIMTHSDDDGFICPPRLAPKQIVMIPIFRTDEEKASVLEYCRSLSAALCDQRWGEDRLRVEIDERDERGGEKIWRNIKRGVPIRLEIGPRDMKDNKVMVAKRIDPPRTKNAMHRDEFVKGAVSMLEEIQKTLFDRALKFRETATRQIESQKDFEEFFGSQGDDETATNTKGGFALCHYSEDPKVTEVLKRLKVTNRCIPLDQKDEKGRCIFTSAPSSKRAVFAFAY